MPDPLQPVAPGTPLLDAVSAEVLNALKREARQVRQQRMPGPSALSGLAAFTSSLIVLIRNDTGADLDALSVLRITGTPSSNGPVNEPFDFQRRFFLTGDVPAGAGDAIAVLKEPAGDGEFGQAVVAGAALADVKINDASHEWARPIAGDTDKLESAASGPARILWKESSGTVRRAVLLLVGGAGALTTLNLQTNSCAVFGTGSNAGVMVGLTVERVPITLPAAWVAGDPTCYLDPNDCCGESGGDGGGIGGSPCCPGIDLPRTLCLTTTSTCPDLNGQSYTLTYSATTGPCGSGAVTAGWFSALFTISGLPAGSHLYWSFACVANSTAWTVALNFCSSGGSPGAIQGSGTIDPAPCSFPATFDVVLENAAFTACGGTTPGSETVTAVLSTGACGGGGGGGGIVNGCCPGGVPTTVHVSGSNGNHYTLAYYPAAGEWAANDPATFPPSNVTLACSGTAWTLHVGSGSATATGTCSPLSLSCVIGGVTYTVVP
jgi:hypothetical protein